MGIIFGSVSGIDYFLTKKIKLNFDIYNQRLKYITYSYVFFMLTWSACFVVIGFYQSQYAYLIMNCTIIFGTIIAVVIKPKVFFASLFINAAIIVAGSFLTHYYISLEIALIFIVAEVVAQFICGSYYKAKVSEYKSILLMEKQGAQLTLLNNELKIASQTDALTGLYNRVYLHEFIDLHWEKCLNSSEVLTVVMVDIDDFKPINDRFGHEAGDECLVRISKLLKNRVEENGGTAFRYGGEEFLFIFPKVGSKKVVELMHQIKEELTKLDINFSQRITITASFGVCEMVPKSNNTFQDIVRNADDMLYSVKKNGKNDVYEYNQYSKQK